MKMTNPWLRVKDANNIVVGVGAFFKCASAIYSGEGAWGHRGGCGEGGSGEGRRMRVKPWRGCG